MVSWIKLTHCNKDKVIHAICFFLGRAYSFCKIICWCYVEAFYRLNCLIFFWLQYLSKIYIYFFVTVVVVEIFKFQFRSYSSGYKDCQTSGSLCVHGFGQFWGIFIHLQILLVWFKMLILFVSNIWVSNGFFYDRKRCYRQKEYLKQTFYFVEYKIA